MSRLIFEARRRLPSPVTRKGSISIEAPPELPRVIPPSLLRRALPVVIVLLIVGMIVAMVATGMRLISPQTLFFPFVLLLAATAFFRGGDNKSRTEEVDAERADYLRYLSVVRDNIRGQAAAQRAAAEWSHPEPADLAAIPGSRRQWERDPQDGDFLVVRAGVHSATLDTALRVNDTADEVDLEPVSHSALRSLLDTQRTVRDVPTGLDLAKLSRVTVLGDADEVRAAVRSWVAQAVTWHDPTVLGVAVATSDLESPEWSWLKWLPHVDIPAEVDGVGPARYLSTKPDELVALLGPALSDRPAFAGGSADALRHLLIIVDDPDFDLKASPLALGRVVFGDLPLHHGLDADPVVGVIGVHQQEGRVGGLAQPVHLLAVRGQVEQDRVAFVVEPHRGQVGLVRPAHHGHDRGHRLVQQPLEARLQVGQARHRLAVADRELARLSALRHVLELRHGNAHCARSFALARWPA